MARPRLKASREGHKVCITCKEEKPKTTEFFAPRRKGSALGVQSECRPCMRTREENWRYKKMYGLSPEERDSMFKEQMGLCAICESPGVNQVLHVDHCHSSGQIRALLCCNCNVGLGNFKDDMGLLARAIKYILYWKFQEQPPVGPEDGEITEAS